MTKVELIKILKPLMKECIKELLMEAVMSKILSETVQKAQQNIQITDNTVFSKKETPQNDNDQQKSMQIQEYRKKMLQEIGKSGYVASGFNPFQNTTSLSTNEAPVENDQISESREPSRNTPPAMNSINPDDPGVDIRGIMSMAAGKWKTHLGGKGK